MSADFEDLPEGLFLAKTGFNFHMHTLNPGGKEIPNEATSILNNNMKE